MRTLSALLIVSLFAGCDTFVDNTRHIQEVDNSTAAKVTLQWTPPPSLTTVFFESTLRSVTFSGSEQLTDGSTAFKYHVEPSTFDGQTSSNDFLFLEWPSECVVTTDGMGLVTGPDGTQYYRFPVKGNQAFDEVIVLTMTSGGAVPEGLASMGSAANNDIPESTKYIVGPSCDGFPTKEISGFVFLDRDPPGEAVANGSYDEGEPGIGGVAVELRSEGLTVGIDFSDVNMDRGVGHFIFEVPDPILYAEGEVPVYSLYLDSSSGGINAGLFPGIVMKSIGGVGHYEEAAVIPGAGPYRFGFQIDVKGAIAKFEENGATTEGLPRAYWRVQGSGKGNPNYNPDMSTTDFASLLNCVGEYPISYFNGNTVNYTCLADRSGLDRPSFGSDDLIDQIFLIAGDGDADRKAALEILKTSSTNDANEALRTQILTALLNYSVGNSIYLGSGDIADRAAMKVIIQNAMYVLLEDGNFSVGNKIGEGPVGENTQLLQSVNGE